MKAIKILKELIFTVSKYTTTKDIEEAIAELENLSDSKHTCEGCKWYEVRNHSASCNWCERHPSRQIRNINIKDYWENKE